MNIFTRRLTGVEVIIILFLAIVTMTWLAMPTVYVGPAKPRALYALYGNMEYLQELTAKLTLDNINTGGPINWTCSGDTPLTLKEWKNALIQGDHSHYNPDDLMTSIETNKLWLWQTTETNSLTVYGVTKDDPPNTVLISSDNWHGDTTTNLSKALFGKKVFLIVRKSGKAFIYRADQTTNAEWRNCGGMHSYLPLK